MQSTPNAAELVSSERDTGVMVPASATQSTASVLGKAQLLLTAFDRKQPVLGLTALARRSGLPKATTYRLAQELVHVGFLERVAGGYQLGWRMFELGQLAPAAAILRQVAQPAMVDLCPATKAAIHLMVPRGLEVLCLEALAGRKEMCVRVPVGTRAPMWFTASGKLFLANDADCDSMVSQLDHEAAAPPTRHSARSSDQLRVQVAAIRTHRWSREREERFEGCKSIAVPITVGGCEQVVAALSATLDVNRRDEQNVTRFLQAAAADISHGLQLGNVSARSASRW
ncbi:IclR family transcriptional regulator [Streptomyces sp. ISID311]|uniref:IclR family transcriptional regulator n=1 Tax=Streptomyces sp. ISID311 TaxID=2601673 RepID=UPI00164C85F1|nr:IclR family transcriptional regulator [Streptomyces sp. ISID311]